MDMWRRRPGANAPVGEQVAWFSDRVQEFLAEREGPDETTLILGLRLVRVANTFIRAEERGALQGKGMRWTRFHVLFILRVVGIFDASNIAQMLGVSRQASSTVLSTMKRDGLIEHVTDEADVDGRLVLWRLSPEGRELVDSALGEVFTVLDDWFSVLSEQEHQDLYRILQKLLRTSVSDDDPQD